MVWAQYGPLTNLNSKKAELKTINTEIHTTLVDGLHMRHLFVTNVEVNSTFNADLPTLNW